MKEMDTARLSASGWRIDRRTSLKLMGAGAAGLVVAETLGPGFGSLASPAAAATGPVEDLALELEFDLERIFRFVTDQVRYEPYAGVLRGAEGTLMARAGNSAHQAVLLAALLKASGIGCRFAQGPIDAPTMEAILASMATDAETVHQEFLEALTGTGGGGRPLTVPEPDAETRARVEEAMAQADQVVAWARDQTALTVSELVTVLRSADIDLPPGFREPPALERDEHVWIQAASGPAWLDLDASLPQALPGDAPAAPATLADPVPDSLRHVINLRVIEESVSGGTLHERALLEVSDFADAIGGQPIGVFDLELQGVKAPGVTIAGALEGGVTYIPCVTLGDSVVLGPGWFRLGMGASPDPFAAVAAGTPGPSDDEPTAEWVEVTVSSPGREPVKVRRAIFDRLGPAARAEADPRSLRCSRQSSSDSNPKDRSTTHLRRRRTCLPSTQASSGATRSVSRYSDRSSTRASPAWCIDTTSSARQGASNSVLPLASVRPFVDAPNLVALTVVQELATEGLLVVRTALDIWHRSFGGLPVTDATPVTSPLILAGVVSHVAERLMFGGAVPGEAATPEVASVGAVFDAARREGVPLRAVRAVDDLASLSHAPDALAHLRDSIEAGLVAVIPARPVRIAGADRSGWWLVDPVTGAAVDQMDDGRGTDSGEYTTIIQRVDVPAASPLRRLALCVGLQALIAQTTPLTIMGLVGAGVYAERGQPRRALGSALLGFGGGVLPACPFHRGPPPVEGCRDFTHAIKDTPTPSGGDPGREGAARFPRWGSQCRTGGCRRGRCERFARVTSSRRGARMRDRDADRGRGRRSRGAMSPPAYRRCLRPDMLRAAGRRGAGLRLTPRWSGYGAGPTGPM